MVVRAWVIVGDDTASSGMPSERSCGWHLGRLPNASGYRPGDHLLWQAGPNASAIAVVCVDLRLEELV